MKKFILLILLLTTVTLVSNSQTMESFEGTFPPNGWSASGFAKSGKNQGYLSVYAAVGTDLNSELIINSVTPSSSDITFYYRHQNNGGPNYSDITVYIWNSSINGGTESNLGTVRATENTYYLATFSVPSVYQSQPDCRVRIVITAVAGNRNLYIDYFDMGVPLPVEMESFTYNVNINDVTLNWKTVWEQNNQGFDVERKSTVNWEKIGFVESNQNRNYSFTDKNLQPGKYQYRLKQIDYNGNYEYHYLQGDVVIGTPDKFKLSQNYPNPFNPLTKIDYQMPFSGKVSLVIYDISGREIKNLINSQNIEAGYYTVPFDGSNLSSGVYFYRIIAETNGQKYVDTKKMVLLK